MNQDHIENQNYQNNPTNQKNQIKYPKISGKIL